MSDNSATLWIDGDAAPKVCKEIVYRLTSCNMVVYKHAALPPPDALAPAAPSGLVAN